MKRVAALLLCIIICLVSCGTPSSANAVDPKNLPSFDGETAYVAINNNIPYFTQDELTTKSYEKYSNLDKLGRCGVAMACVGRDIMPTEDRQSIGQVKPTGWQTVKYDCVDGKYLYNRCHLIGFQLTGENANEKNLITGTRYLNIEGMLPFENMVADYVKETNNHVLYRVTPIFEGNNLVASGVQLEGFSVEDNGEAVCFNVYAYNAQPQISIDYKTGKSEFLPPEEDIDLSPKNYVLNTNSKKFHREDCSDAKNISDKNKQQVTSTRQELIASGYSPCGNCHP